MSLSCGCDFGDGPECYRASTVTARKTHLCVECKGPINAGDRYQYVFGVWDGDPRRYHTCESCTDLWSSLEALGFCLCHGELMADYREYLIEYAPQKI